MFYSELIRFEQFTKKRSTRRYERVFAAETECRQKLADLRKGSWRTGRPTWGADGALEEQDRVKMSRKTVLGLHFYHERCPQVRYFRPSCV